MSLIGINVAGDGHESPADIAATGAKAIRVVAVQGHDIREWLEEIKSLDIKILLVIARESVGEGDWYTEMRKWAIKYGDIIDYLQAGNEYEAAPNSASSWTMSPESLSHLLREARRAFGDDMYIIGAGMCSGVAGLADPVDWSPVNATAIQPYGTLGGPAEEWQDVPGGFNYFPDLIETYRHLGKPIWVTEIGTDGFYASEETQARYLRNIVPLIASMTEGVFWFNMSDWDINTPNYGIVRGNGTKKLSYYAFQDVAGVTVTPRRPTFVLGFKDAHDSNPELVGDAMENEFGGVRDISFQLTSNGQLTWSNTVGSGSVLMFLDTRDGTRYRWDGSKLNAIT